MQDLINLVGTYGVSIVIVGLFLWDWVANKKKIVDALEEMKISNANTAKSLELLQKSMETNTIELKQINDKLDRKGD